MIGNTNSMVLIPQMPVVRMSRSSGGGPWGGGEAYDLTYDNVIQNDNGEYFDVVSSSSGVNIVRIKKAGYYLVCQQVYAYRSQDGRIQSSIRLNSTIEGAYSLTYAPANVRITDTLVRVMHLNTNDQISPSIWSDSGGTLALAVGTGYENNMSVTCLSID